MRSVHYQHNNDVKLLESGVELFPALLAEIDAAEQEIHFETYIFAADETARAVEAALIGAARRGVKVRIVIDWFGTGNAQCKRLSAAFTEAGAHCRIFNRWFRKGVTRTHRKITVVDRKVAFVGGINVNDDHLCDYDPERAPARAPLGFRGAGDGAPGRATSTAKRRPSGRGWATWACCAASTCSAK